MPGFRLTSVAQFPANDNTRPLLALTPTQFVPKARKFIGVDGELTAQDEGSVLLGTLAPLICRDGTEALDSVNNCTESGCPFGYECVNGGCCHAQCSDGSFPLIRPKTCDSDANCVAPEYFCDNHVCCRRPDSAHTNSTNSSNFSDGLLAALH